MEIRFWHGVWSGGLKRQFVAEQKENKRKYSERFGGLVYFDTEFAWVFRLG